MVAKIIGFKRNRFRLDEEVSPVLKPLPKEEITPEILAAFERSRKLLRSEFVNL